MNAEVEGALVIGHSVIGHFPFWDLGFGAWDLTGGGKCHRYGRQKPVTTQQAFRFVI
jgi:hypothetical protein